jgi:Zn-dependent protease with chaperone function
MKLSSSCYRTAAAVGRAAATPARLLTSLQQPRAPSRRGLAVRAYQDAAPSSPWPRQQGVQQPQAPAPSSGGGNGASGAAAAAAGAAPQQQARRRVTAYRGLSAAQFQHPLDQQNTALLRALPGLEMVARNMMGPVAEKVLLLENIGTSVKVGPTQLPTLHHLLTEAAAILQMEVPDLYVRQNPLPNAYTLAIAGRKPFIVLHTALLDLLTPAEVQAVLAHELGHLKCDHGVWLTAANVLALGTVSLLPIVSSAVEEGLMRWLRAAELTCDRAALLVAQDPKVVISVLLKLAWGSPSFAGELTIEAVLGRARSYDEATNSPVGWYLRNAQTRALSHPLPVLRAREVDRWAHSQQFQALVAANLPRDANGGSSSGSGTAAGSAGVQRAAAR